MNESELIALVDKVSVLMEQYQRNTEKVGVAYQQSVQRLQLAVENVPNQLEQTIGRGIERLGNDTNVRIDRLLFDFQKKADDLHKLNNALRWKVIASVVGAAVALMIGFAFLLPHYINETKKYQISAEVLKNYQSVDLAKCGDQLCAKLAQTGKKGDYVPIERKAQ